MPEKKLNISKIIITVIIVAIMIALIVVLTIFLTNKKEAVYVASEQTKVAENVSANKTEENITTNKTEENVWKIQTNNNNITDTSNTTIVNNISTDMANNIVNNNTTTNTNAENNTNTETNTNTEPSATNTTTNNATEETKKQDNKQDFKGVIFLTFDDGPSSNITPKILDILKKENIKATFFVINYSDTNEHLVKRAVEEGHTIGIHGYSHEYSKIYKSKETFMDNVYTLQSKIEKSTGVKTWYTRFPGGSSNTVSRKYCKGIMTDLTKEMLEKGFKYYDWNISSGDAGGAKTAKDVYNNVTKNLSKKRGNMVLMHDFGSNKKGLEALPDIIAYAKKEGYTFAAIDDNTPMYAQKVNN